MAKSLEKLSSGFRINRAGDDAAGLVISEKLRSQVSGLKVATRNAQDGISVIQTAEGALTETHALLQRVRDLAVQGANSGGNDRTARDAAAAEVTQALSEIDRIANATKFGGQTLLNGTGVPDTTKNFTFQVGSEAGVTNQVSVAVNAMDSASLDLRQQGAETAASQTSAALTTVTTSAANNTLTIDLGGGTSATMTLANNAYANTDPGRQLLADDVNAKIAASSLAGKVTAT